MSGDVSQTTPEPLITDAMAERYTRDDAESLYDAGWNNAVDEIDLQLRSKCPSLDANGYIAELSEVIKIVRSVKRG